MDIKYAFVSEKEVDGSIYQAFRDSNEPSTTMVYKDGEFFEYEGDFKQFWITL